MSWQLSLTDLEAGTLGRVLSRQTTSFAGIGTDTRLDLSGKVFIALKGEAFDAHDFLNQAIEKGAAVLVVHRLPEGAAREELLRRVSVVLVDDTLKALQRLGQFWRRSLRARIIGITGTNGKTTTKEFTAAILSTKFKVQYSKGSFNNHWGVPLSLLSITPEHDIAVIEIGMNHLGEIRDLVMLAEPDVIGLTMVGRGHLEGLGTLEGVARAKEEIYWHAPAECVRIFNLDNPFTLQMYERARTGAYGNGKRLTFSSNEKSDVHFITKSADADSLSIQGEIAGISGSAVVPVFGAHNLNNLMLAAAFAFACGMTPAEIWRALPNCRSGWGRNHWVNLTSGAKVLFDAYNANPESMRAALSNFKSLKTPGRKIAILAEMLEMGAETPVAHREVGELAAAAGFDALYFIGPSGADFAAGAKAAGFKKTLVLSTSYEHFLASGDGPVIDPTDIVLMKGSRGMQLERVLQDWKPLDFSRK